MATGEPFGYGLLSGLTYSGTTTVTSAIQQALGAANAYGGTAYMNYEPGSGQWAITTNPYHLGAPMTASQPERQPSKSKCCGRGEAELHAPDCWKLTDVCDCHVGRASKNHSMLERLRMEIGRWHGDILERCPA